VPKTSLFRSAIATQHRLETDRKTPDHSIPCFAYIVAWACVARQKLHPVRAFKFQISDLQTLAENFAFNTNSSIVWQVK